MLRNHIVEDSAGMLLHQWSKCSGRRKATQLDQVGQQEMVKDSGTMAKVLVARTRRKLAEVVLLALLHPTQQTSAFFPSVSRIDFGFLQPAISAIEYPLLLSRLE